MPFLCAEATSHAIATHHAAASSKQLLHLKLRLLIRSARAPPANGLPCSSSANLVPTPFSPQPQSLVGELQNEVSEGVSLAREKGFSASDAIARVKKVVAAIDSLFISGILTLADEPSKPADMNGGADSSMEVAPGSPAPTGGAATGADSIDADADDRDSLLSESAINRLGPI
uniref:Uncharacterized protein n=1 Tax=Chrysotila carterae TaxID=13221 RepID=A0A7S4BMA4_CHRCT